MRYIYSRKIKARDPVTGEFEGINAFAAESTEEYLARIQQKGEDTLADVEAQIVKKGAETLASIPEDYTALHDKQIATTEVLDKYNSVNCLDVLKRPNNTMYGVSYTWLDKDSCRINSNGVAATSNSYCIMHNKESGMPESFEAGETYIIDFSADDYYDGLRFNLTSYDADGALIENKQFKSDCVNEYTIPSNTASMRVAIVVIDGSVVDGLAKISVYNALTNKNITHRVKALIKAVQTEYCDFANNSFCKLDIPIGDTVDLTQKKSSSYKSAIIPCRVGDVFIITGSGGGGEARLWAFLDENCVLLDVAYTNSVLTDYELMAKHNGYFVVNLNMKKDNKLLYYGEKNPSMIESKYDKRHKVAICNVPTNLYIGYHEDKTGLTLNSTYAQMIAKFDELVDGVYVTKEDLGERSRFTSYVDPETGEESGDAETGALPHIYCYTVEPIMYGASPVDIPTVIISASVHGDEKSATYGMMYFVKDMLEHAIEDPVLMYMRSNIRFKLIPGANPWGWDKAVKNSDYPLGRFNARGVNINRNFGHSTWEAYDDRIGAWEYGAKGDSPFSEIETQYIKKVIDDNPNAILYIDWHTNGRFNSSAQYHDVRNLFVGWVAKLLSKDIYARKLVNAAVSMATVVKPFTDSLYGVNDTNGYVYGSGRFTDGTKPTAYDWCAEATKIPAYLCETPPGSNVGYLGDKLTHYSPDLIKYNAELFVNYLMKSLNELK